MGGRGVPCPMSILTCHYKKKHVTSVTSVTRAVILVVFFELLFLLCSCSCSYCVIE